MVLIRKLLLSKQVLKNSGQYLNDEVHLLSNLDLQPLLKIFEASHDKKKLFCLTARAECVFENSKPRSLPQGVR